jgi:hypothetical protein
MTDASVARLTLDCVAPLPTLQDLKDRVEAVLREREMTADEPLVCAFVVLLALLHAVGSGIQDGERRDLEASLADLLGGRKLLIYKPGSGFEVYVGSDQQPMAPYHVRSRVLYSLLAENLIGLFFRYVQTVRSGARTPIWCDIVEVAMPKSNNTVGTLCRWQDKAHAAGLIDAPHRRGRSDRSTATKPGAKKAVVPQVAKPDVQPQAASRQQTTEVWLRHAAPGDVLLQLDKVLQSGVFPKQTKDTRAALAAGLLAAYGWENRETPSTVELVEACLTKLLGEERHLWIEISLADRELRLVLANSQGWRSSVSVEVGGTLVKDMLHPSTRWLLANLAYAADRMTAEPIPDHVHGPTNRIRRLNRLRLLKAYLARPLPP